MDNIQKPNDEVPVYVEVEGEIKQEIKKELTKIETINKFYNETIIPLLEDKDIRVGQILQLSVSIHESLSKIAIKKLVSIV